MFLTEYEIRRIGEMFPELRLLARLLIGHQNQPSYYHRCAELLQLIYLIQDLRTFRPQH